VNYDAMHNAEYPLHGGSVDSAALGRAIDRDFAQISKHFKHARTFYSSFFNIPVAPYAAKYGVKLYLGVFMTDQSWYKDQVDAAVDAIRKYPGTVSAVFVGNENLRSNGPYSANDIISRVNNIRSRIKSETGRSVPVGTVQRITEWLNQGISSETSKLASSCDILGVNIYPFFGNYDHSNPIRALDQQWNAMLSKYGSEKVRLTETGYPTSGGSSPSGVRADLSEAMSYFNAFREWKSKGKGPAFWFAFHDRRDDDNSVPGGYEKHFGLVNADGNAKAANFPPLAN
ncbi:family 17 glucosidase SCW11, partial [Brachionus plicatilis]